MKATPIACETLSHIFYYVLAECEDGRHVIAALRSDAALGPPFVHRMRFATPGELVLHAQGSAALHKCSAGKRVPENSERWRAVKAACHEAIDWEAVCAWLAAIEGVKDSLEGA